MKEIKNFPGYFITTGGEIWSAPKKGSGGHDGKWLKLCDINSYGHKTVQLFKNKKPFMCLVHRLVLETFVGPCPEGMECCHNDGNPSNNNLNNLRWDTTRNNHADSIKHKTHQSLKQNGEMNPSSKLREQDVRMIIYMWMTEEFTQREIATVYNVTIRNINMIVNKKSWKHIWRN